MSIENFYTTTALIKKITRTTAWASTESWATTSTIQCAINPVRGKVIMLSDKEGLYADYKLFCGSSVTIDETRRVVWKARTYDVVFAKNTFGMDHHLNVLLKRCDT